ncbi:MAG: hypothetical protein WCD68_11135, partial [Candidatus Acidiferrum sp.]
MTGRFLTIFRFAAALCIIVLFCCPQCTLAQRVEDSCHAFFENPHQALDCIEAMFTQTDIPYYLPHLTMSSIPPDNGFPIGIVYEKRTHYVSSTFSEPDQSTPPAPGYKSLVDAKAAAVISTNDSWYATGSVTWLPPVPYRGDKRTTGETCHRLWAFCTKQVLG